jgi:DNA-binding HxlR family transcriptional regulator
VKRYGQYCPVSRAAEVLAERWTLLVIRELLCGSDRFNEISRGVPRMSPSLLSARLRELERSGIVIRTVVEGEPRYALTEAGLELRPLLELTGAWGQRWMQDLRANEYDPALLMLDIAREVGLRSAELPRAATTVQLSLSGVPKRFRRWWWVFGTDGVDVCDVDPGRTVAVWMQTDIRTLTDIWLGRTAWSQGLREQKLLLDGDRAACSRLPEWLGVSRYAKIPLATAPLPRLD